MAALRSRCGHYIFALWFLSIFYPRLRFMLNASLHVRVINFRIYLFLSSPNLSGRRWDVYHAGLKCDARWKYRTQKLCKKSPSAHHRTTLSGYIFATKARIDNWKKMCSHNMVNVGPLAAEIVSLVCGTLANFDGFRVWAALLHSQTAALNRGRHLYSAGRPSRRALAHILVRLCFVSTLR